jgi:hypothetical protein
LGAAAGVVVVVAGAGLAAGLGEAVAAVVLPVVGFGAGLAAVGVVAAGLAAGVAAGEVAAGEVAEPAMAGGGRRDAQRQRRSSSSSSRRLPPRPGHSQAQAAATLKVAEACL